MKNARLWSGLRNADPVVAGGFGLGFLILGGLALHYDQGFGVLAALIGFASVAYLVTSSRRQKIDDPLFRSNIEFCCLLDEHGAVLDANDAFYGLYGSDRPLGLCSFFDLVDPWEIGRVRSLINDARRFRAEFEFETCQAEGEKARWISWIVGAERHQGRLVLAGRDITFRKLAIDELFESEGRYRLVVDNAKEVIFRREPNGKILFVNKAWEELTGFAVEDTIGKAYEEFIFEEDREKRVSYELGLEKTGARREGRIEIRVACKGGGFKWCEVSFRTNYDSQGNPIDTVGSVLDISEKKSAFETVQREQDLRNTIFEHVRSLILVVDSEGAVLGMNRAAESLFGSEAPARGAATSWLSQDPNGEKPARLRPGSQDLYWNRKDGPTTLIEWQNTEIDDPDSGRIIVGIGNDVTEIRALEEELAKSRERYELAVLGSSDSLWDWDIRTGELYFAPRLYEILGMTAGEKIDTVAAFCELVHPDDQARTEATMREYLGGAAGIFQMEFRMRTKAGDYRWILSRGIATRNEDGAPTRMSGSHTDITEAKLKAEALAYSQARLAEAQKLAHVGSWEFDLRTQETFWSDEMYRIFGLPVDGGPPLSREELRAHIPREDLSRIEPVIRHAMETGAPYVVDHRIILLDGTYKYVATKGRPIEIVDGVPTKFAGTYQDITERKVFEEELVRTRESALESARIKSEFLANMSHEIRTPMNGVIGMSELLSYSELSEEQNRYVAAIKDSANALLAILNDILDFSKIEAGKLDLEMTPFLLNELVQNSAQFFQPIAERKGLELAVEVDDEISHPYFGDQVRIRQILTNLIGNALKFTRQGTVSIGAHLTPGGIKLVVSDTGIGIPIDRQAAIFDSFTQADGSTTRKFGGTGLGLAIVKQLVSLMGGSIRLDSREGEGSAFTINLPLEKATLKRTPAPKAKPTGKLSRQIRVLVAEDNEVNRQVVGRHLERLGTTPDFAENGKQALDMALATAYDVILMDIQMPEMDGFEAVRRLREAQGAKRTPVIAMTAHAMKGDRERCLEAGMDDYISKPIDKDLLLAALEEATSGQTLPVLDLDHLADLSGGDAEFESEVVETFASTAPQMIDQLRLALEGGDGELAKRLAHTLKGSSRSIGATDFGMVAQRVEEAIREGRPVAIETLKEAYGRFELAWQAHYGKKAA